MEAKEGRFVNGIPVVRLLSYKPKGAIEKVVHPIFVEQDGTLYLLQHVRMPGSDYPFYYYVDIGTAVKEFMFHTANVEPEEKNKDCRYCKFSGVGEDEEPCVSCWDRNTFQSLSFEFREPGTFVYNEPKASQDTVNLKLRDINDNWYEIEVPVKEKTHPLTFKDVKIGDELSSIPSSPMYESTVIIVTHNCADRIYGFRKNTGAYLQLGQSDLSGWRKTGKTYPEIAKLIGGRDA